MRLEGITPVQFLEQSKFIVHRLGVREVVFSYHCRIELVGESPPQMFIVTDTGKLLNYGAAPPHIADDPHKSLSRFLSVEFPGVTFFNPSFTVGGPLTVLVDCRGPAIPKGHSQPPTMPHPNEDRLNGQPLSPKDFYDHSKPLTAEDLDDLIAKHENGVDTDDLGPYLGSDTVMATDSPDAMIEINMGPGKGPVPIDDNF